MIDEILTLIANKEFIKLRSTLSNMNAPDIALILEELPEGDVFRIFRLLPKELAADTFVEMDPDMQEQLIGTFSDMELRAVFDELYIDDTVDIIEEMPANVLKRILRQADSETRNAINKILNYPKDSAESIMTIEYVDLKANMTVQQAFARIRATGVDKETIYTCYVTDLNRKLIGITSVKDLLLSAPDTKVLLKELSVSFLCGAALAAINFIKMMVIDQNAALASGQNPVLIALVVSLTLFLTVVCAKLVGCSLSILVKKLGFDPAVTASPFVTTIVDAISLLIYFQIAMNLLSF